MASVALEEVQLVLVGGVVVEPARSHDRVVRSARPQEPFGASFPVVGLGGSVVLPFAVGDADRRHQGDPDATSAESGEHIADALVVDRLRPGGALSVRTEGEHDRLDAFDRCAEGLRPGHVSHDELGRCREHRSALAAADEGANVVSGGQRLDHDVASDAAGGADDEHGEAAHLAASAAGAISLTAASPFSVRG